MKTTQTLEQFEESIRQDRVNYARPTLVKDKGQRQNTNHVVDIDAEPKLVVIVYENGHKEYVHRTMNNITYILNAYKQLTQYHKQKAHQHAELSKKAFAKWQDEVELCKHYRARK